MNINVSGYMGLVLPHVLHTQDTELIVMTLIRIRSICLKNGKTNIYFPNLLS